MKYFVLSLTGAAALFLGESARADVKVTAERSESGFKFSSVPSPARRDAATAAKFQLLDGASDANGAGLAALHDGRAPTEEDQPSANFFFAAGTEGGRVQIDLGQVITVKEVRSYSWHGGTRGPQVYQLYVADGTADGFQAEPKKNVKPADCGWKSLAHVDTRPAEGNGGGAHGVMIADTNGPLGKFRYLLLEVSPTETRDPFGNTFYSEIDVIDASAPAVAEAEEKPADAKRVTKSFEAGDGKYRFTIEATVAPDLMEWADTQLRPVVQEWYPKIVAMLPSEGFNAPTNVTLRFRDNMGGTPASAGGGNVNMNSGWFRRELKREARGSVVHELVHVVQSYGRGRRTNPNATRMPGWLVEGIPDYIRWFLYEPETKGAEITERNLSRAKHDASYRISGNFLDWVTRKYDKDLVRKLNAAGREGRYMESLWKEYTDKSLEDLSAEWKKFHEDRLAAAKAKSTEEPKPATEPKPVREPKPPAEQ